MNERDSTLLNDYFNRLLDPDEARAVETRAANDPVFGAEFALRAEMEDFPRKEAQRDLLIDTLKSVGAEYFKQQLAETPQIKVVRNNIRRWIALAASVTLIAAAIWFFTRTDEPTYQHYALHAPLSLTVMGKTEQVKSEAEAAFGKKDYANALAALEQVLIAEPDNIKAKLYRGICLLELGRTTEARSVFDPLTTGNSALREDAVWYIALSYLKENNLNDCKATLAKIAPGEAHYEAAQEILGE